MTSTLDETSHAAARELLEHTVDVHRQRLSRSWA
jgi:hypothetical protein